MRSQKKKWTAVFYIIEGLCYPSAILCISSLAVLSNQSCVGAEWVIFLNSPQSSGYCSAPAIMGSQFGTTMVAASHSCYLLSSLPAIHKQSQWGNQQESLQVAVVSILHFLCYSSCLAIHPLIFLHSHYIIHLSANLCSHHTTSLVFLPSCTSYAGPPKPSLVSFNSNASFTLDLPLQHTLLHSNHAAPPHSSPRIPTASHLMTDTCLDYDSNWDCQDCHRQSNAVMWRFALWLHCLATAVLVLLLS